MLCVTLIIILTASAARQNKTKPHQVAATVRRYLHRLLRRRPVELLGEKVRSLLKIMMRTLNVYTK